MNRYAFMGINEPVPHLSATASGAQGKRFRNAGGYASEGCRYVEKYGLPTVEHWPERSMDRTLPHDPNVKKSAERHELVKFGDMDAGDLDLAVSALIDRMGRSRSRFRYRGGNMPFVGWLCDTGAGTLPSWKATA